MSDDLGPQEHDRPVPEGAEPEPGPPDSGLELDEPLESGVAAGAAPTGGGEEVAAEAAPTRYARQARRAGGASPVIITVLVVVALGLAALCAKLYVDQQSTVEFLKTYAQRVPASLPAGAPEAVPVEQRVNKVRTALAQGDLMVAQKALDELTPDMIRKLPAAGRGPQPRMPGPGIGLGPGGGAGPGAPPQHEVPPEVQKFAAAHPELGARFERAFAIGAQLNADGQDITQLKEMLREFLHAAKLGDEEHAKSVVDRAEGWLAKNAPGAEPPALEGLPDAKQRGELKQLLDRFRTLYQLKERSGADLRATTALFREAGNLLDKGDFAQGKDALGKAYEALKRAPRGRGPRRGPGPGLARGPGGPMGGGPQAGFLGWLVPALLRSMAVEDQALESIRGQVSATRDAIREQNQDQVREMLAGVLGKLGWIAARRNALNQALHQREQTFEGGGKGRPGRGPGRGAPRGMGGPERPNLGPAEARAALMEAFGSIREAQADDWKAQAEQRADEILGRLYGPEGLSTAQKTDALVPPAEELPDKKATEQAVLVAFQSLEPLYLALVKENRDRTRLDQVLDEARKAYYARDYDASYAKLREVAGLAVAAGGDLLDRMLRLGPQQVIEAPTGKPALLEPSPAPTPEAKPPQ